MIAGVATLALVATLVIVRARAIPEYPYGSDPAAIAAEGGIEGFRLHDDQQGLGWISGEGKHSGATLLVIAFDSEAAQMDLTEWFRQLFEKGPVGRTQWILSGPSWTVYLDFGDPNLARQESILRDVQQRLGGELLPFIGQT